MKDIPMNQTGNDIIIYMYIPAFEYLCTLQYNYNTIVLIILQYRIIMMGAELYHDSIV